MEDQLKTFAMIYTSTASIKPSDNLRSPSHKEISGHTSLLSSDTSVAKFGSATASSTSSNDTTPSESFLKGKATKGLTHAFNQNYTTEVCWEVHKSKYCSKNTSRLDTSLEDFDGVSQNDNEVGNEESICDNYATENDEYNDVFDNDSVSETAKNSGKMESTLRPSNAIDMEDRSQDYADLREIDGITLESRLSLSENYVRDTFTIDYDRTGWREIDLFLKEKNDLDKSQTCSYTQCNSTDASETNRGNSIVNETDNAETDTCETDFNGANDSDTEINDNEKYNSIFSETDITDKNFESADEIEKECNETELGNTDCDETDIADTENNETDEDETDMDRSDTYETDTDRPETDKTSISSTAKSFKDAEDSNSTGGDNKDQQGNAMISYHGELELERPILQKARTKWHRLSTNMELESPDREHKCLRSRHSWLRCNSYEKESTVSLKRHIETPFSQESNSLEYDSMSMKSESTSPTQELTSAIRAMSVMRSRLANLRKIIHDKNEKIRELKARMKVEKTNSRCRELMAQREKQNRQSMEVVSSAELLHLRRELAALRQEKERLKAELATKAAMEKERMVEVRKLKQEHERQLKLVKMEARKEEVRENRELSLLQRTIMAKEKELRERQLVIHKLECEKLYLGEEIYRITGVEEGFWSDQTLARPLLTEKERCLVRRNSSLNTQLSRLQIHCKTLSSENSTLKNKMEVELERPLELKEKDRHRQREMQLLKKKNTELASITRKLEEKVKSLEKKTKESPATERRNLMQARQREKEALYEKQLLERDREIQRLKLRMRELVRKLTGKNGEITRAQSTLELEQIIRTVTKERLQLERHLAAASEGLSRGGSGEADVGRLASLEETNNTLRQQLEDLELLTRQHHTLQRHVQEKDLECVTLKEKLKLKNELCHDLDAAHSHPRQESQLARVIEKNTELTIQNSDLQKQIQELQHVSEECRTLKHTLTQVETDWSSAKVQVGSLQNKFGNLESVLRLEDVYGFADGSRPRGGSSLETVLIQMKDAADKRRDLERQHAEALAQLRERQASIADPSKANEKERKASVEVVEALQSKIRELEKKAEVQNLRHEELLLEMQSLKKAQGSPKNSWTRSLSADLQSPDSGDVTPDSSQILSNGSTARSTPVPHSGMGLSLPHSLDVIGLVDLPDSLFAHHQPPMSTSPLTGQSGQSWREERAHWSPSRSSLSPSRRTHKSLNSLNSISSGVYTNTTSSSFVTSGSGGFLGTSPLPSSGTVENASSEIDRIMAKIEQDNKILAELDKSRSTIDKNLMNGNIPGLMLPPYETDNRVLDVLEIPGKGRCHVYIARYSYDPFQHSPNENPEAELAVNAGDYVLVWGSMDEVAPPTIDGFFDGELLDGRRGLVPSNFVEKLIGEDLIEFHQSVVMGLRDGDESMSTSVPQDLDFISQDESQLMIDTNAPVKFVKNIFKGVQGLFGQGEKNEATTLVSTVLGSTGSAAQALIPKGPLVSQSGHGLLTPLGSFNPLGALAGHKNPAQHGVPSANLATNQIRHNAYTSNIDLEDIIEEDEETLGEHDLFFSVLVPPPVQLTLERQLNKSIVIGWNPPPDAPQGSIESYHVYVNGLLKTTVRATERTRALVEGVDSTKLHRISVRSVTPNRRTSRDAACTMVIGKDAPLGPTSVKATSITSTSAVISWLPSNSNFQHTVCVNNVEVRTVKPGVYRHTITGLSPNTTYRVTIRAKNLRAPQFDEKATRNQDRLSTTIEFRTLPKDAAPYVGLPDPPVDVQVEPGPQDGSLLVTWLPVTINSTGGTSNGAPVTGYAVYADGKKVTEVESPTGDHALIDLTKIPGSSPSR
ncbi:RIMS-binding protein 3 isoform X14 [Procambarus clarkii]|uniref:RIMS-binding protein 3 isoform X14 n=1 Tax=Procambarus clarkii TaxID=6728 RepID=UPI0037445837